ncbi:hypothetical protein F5Y15DRAFT_257891 [Xylariaceae sp. FL0016]|nr:hypothetical protein F5Y15DRAFT_257891 [Xylariaceae sp. FL0016]
MFIDGGWEKGGRGTTSPFTLGTLNLVRLHSTLFYSITYIKYDQCPARLADVAGYIAEDPIFGSVVLFERDKPAQTARTYICTLEGEVKISVRVWRPEGITVPRPRGVPHYCFRHGKTVPFYRCCLIIRERVREGKKKKIKRNWRTDDWDVTAIHRIHQDPWERK